MEKNQTPPLEKTLAAARNLLAAEEQKAQAAFAAEINEVCKKHGYNLQAKADVIAVKA